MSALPKFCAYRMRTPIATAATAWTSARCLWLALTLALLAACTPEPDPVSPAPAEPAPLPIPAPPPPALLPAAPSLPDPMMAGSYLSRHLPPDTVAYLRVPNPWASLGDVVGRPADPAYSSVAWRQQLELLKNAVFQAGVQDQWPPGLAYALRNIDGPVEFALVAANTDLSADPKLWVTTKLSVDQPQQVAEWLDQFQVSPPAAAVAESDPQQAAEAAIDQDSTETSSADATDEGTEELGENQTASTQPMAAVKVAFDANGYGKLDLGLPQPALLKFDSDLGRLHLLLSMVEDHNLRSLLGSLSQESSHPARAQIEAVDHSGRGMAAWINPALLEPLVSAQEHSLKAALAAGSGWSAGIGTVDGHGQISLSLAGVDPQILAILPKGTRELPVTSAANPDWALLLALPSAVEWAALKNWVNPPAPDASAASGSDPDKAPDEISQSATQQADDPAQNATAALADQPRPQSWLDKLDDSLRQISGISAATLFSRVGPELAIWQDSAGTFAALRVKDPDGVDSLLAHLSGRLSGQLKMRRWNGMDIHEYSFVMALATEDQNEPVQPSVATGEIDESAVTDAIQATEDEGAPATPANDGADVPTSIAAAARPDPEPGFWNAGLERLRSRAYWIEENQFLVIAELPQVLADRQFSPEKTTLQTWLKDGQSRDPAGTIVMATAVSDDLHRDSYHGMITVLQALGDVLLVEVDPYAFPNADELRLPEQGSVSARLGIAGNQLTLSLSYEDSPAELLQGPGGLATVAGAGVLAAIAIPAYHDYQTRTELRRALSHGLPLREFVEQYQQQRRRWPRDLQQFDLSEESAHAWNSGRGEWRIDDGHLLLSYPEADEVPAALRGQTLALTLLDGIWQCQEERSSIAPRLSQSVCADLYSASDKESVELP